MSQVGQTMAPTRFHRENVRNELKIHSNIVIAYCISICFFDRSAAVLTRFRAPCKHID